MSDAPPPGAVTATVPVPDTRPPKVRLRPGVARVEPAILPRALLAALLKLDPRHLARSPVMFVVEIGSERFVG